jgi:hypothetical protein
MRSPKVEVRVAELAAEIAAECHVINLMDA